MYDEIALDEKQRDAVERMHNGCILNGGTGSGKTRTALTYYIEKACKGSVTDWDVMEEPKDLYIITTARKRDTQDWQNYCAKFGLNENEDLSRNAITVTVDSWNNIGRYREVKNAHFIFDEQRAVGSGAWATGFVHIAKSNSWILLSATPGDTWLDYIPVFVANGYYKNRTAFKREHVIYNNYAKFPRVDRYVGINKLVRYKKDLLVDLNHIKHTTRIFEEVVCDYDTELMEQVSVKRWHVYENRPLRDAAELCSVMRKVVNSDPSRLTAVRDLLETHSKIIVFYNFDYELEMLRTLGSATQTTPAMETNVEEVLIDAGRDSGSSTDPQSSMSETTTPSITNPTLSEEKTECLRTCHQTTTVDKLDLNTEENQETSHSKRRGLYASSSHDTERLISSTSSVAIQDVTEDQDASMKPTMSLTEPLKIAEWNGHKHQPVPSGDRWVYLVQYVAGAEAWECTSTDVMVFWSLTYSYKVFDQAQGRIDRRNTRFTKLKYYIFRSNSGIDRAITNALKSKKDFNERKYRAKWDN